MSKVVEIAIRGIDEATRVFESVGSAAEKSMDSAENSVRSVDESIMNVSSLDVDTSDTEKAMDNAESSIKSVDDSVNSVDDLDIDTGGTESSMSGARDSILGVQDALEETGDEGESFGSRMSTVFDNVMDKWLEVTVVAGTAGLGLEGFAKSQGQVNATFDRTAIATGISAEALRDMAVDMAGTTTNTDQQAESFEMLVQRGIDTEEQFRNIIPHVSNLGTATGTDLQPALESADKLLKPFGQNLDDLGDNVDQMTRIMTQTDIPLGALERNLGRIPDELSKLEFGLDDAAAGIEVFRSRGYEGREAVREFRKAVDESEGDMDAFLETMGLTNKEWEEYQKQVEPAIGLTEDIAGVNEDNMTVIEKMQSNLSNLMVEYGAFADLASMLAPILMALGPIMKGVSMAVGVFNAILALNPIVLIIGSIIALIAIIAVLWKNWDSISAFLAKTWQWIKDIAVEYFGGLGEYLSAFWEWIKEIIFVVWDSIVEFFKATWEFIKEIFSSVMEFIGDIISSAWEWIKDITISVWESVIGFFTGIWEYLTDLFFSRLELLKDILSTVWNFIKDTIVNVFTAIKDFFVGIWENFVDTVKTNIETIKSIVTTIFDAIKNVITTVWNTIKNVSTTVWNAIVSTVKGIITAFSNVIKSTFDKIVYAITTVWNNLKNFTVGVWNGMVSIVKGIITGFSNIIKTTFNKMKFAITNVWDSVKNSTQSIWKGIVNVVKAPINAIIGMINGMINALNGINIKIPKVPDWVPLIGGKGGGSIGFNIPNIPSLATGGVVSTPTLAMVGDAGRGNPEIVAPQKMIAQIVGEELRKILGSVRNVNQYDDRPLEIIIPVMLEGREIARVTAPYMDRELGKRRHNKSRSEGD